MNDNQVLVGQEEVKSIFEEFFLFMCVCMCVCIGVCPPEVMSTTFMQMPTERPEGIIFPGTPDIDNLSHLICSLLNVGPLQD